MENLLTLSRAAKLVGVSRGSLQKKVQDGELESFEGFIQLADLSRAYPEADIQPRNEMERYERIVEQALIRARYGKLQQLTAPDLATMTARAGALNKELLAVKERYKHTLSILETLQEHLQHPEENRIDPATARHLSQWLSHSLSEAEAAPASAAPHLLDRDAYLRVMAAHVRLLPSGHDFFVEGSDSILEAALRNGHSLNYGCNSGNCGLCKARVVAGEVKTIRHSDYRLSEAERLDHVVLMCCNTPVTDITLQAEVADDAHDIPLQTLPVTLRKLDEQDGVLVLSTRTPRTQRLRFMAGQTVKVHFDERVSAELHIASCPCDDMNIQFHIPKVAGAAIAEYVQHKLDKNQKLQVTGPHGEFVLPEESLNPLLFIAYGTGFAPTKALIESALAKDMAEAIHLYRVAGDGETYYLRNVCRAWTDALDGFHYTEVHARPGDLGHLQAITQAHPRLRDYLVYIAGPRPWVEVAERYFDGLQEAPARVVTEAMVY